MTEETPTLGQLTTWSLPARTVCEVPGCPEPVSRIVIDIVLLDRRPDQERVFCCQVCDHHAEKDEVQKELRRHLRMRPPAVIDTTAQ